MSRWEVERREVVGSITQSLRFVKRGNKRVLQQSVIKTIYEGRDRPVWCGLVWADVPIVNEEETSP